MRILITGATGQLGSELRLALSHHTIISKDLPDFDLTASDVEEQVVEAKPDLIVHAGAYTDVDGAERDPERARAVNVRGTARIAAAARRTGARLYYISTDYVFDGAATVPYTEIDRPHPLNQYGLTKWEGEQVVLSSGAGTLVIRTAWLYGVHGNNFVKSIMRGARAQPVLKVVDDQLGCPTHAGDLAATIRQLIDRPVDGVLHVTNRGQCTWYEFAKAIVDEIGLSVPVLPISTLQAGRLAGRPAYSVLSLQRLTSLGIEMPHWKEALKRFMRLQSVPAVAAR